MSAPSDSALGGSPTETPTLITEDRVRAIAVEIANDEDLNTVEIMNLCFDYLASQRALRAAREQNAAHEAEIARLSTPDIAGYNDEIGYEEDSYDGLRDYLNPNSKPITVWCNRSLGEWFAVRLVVSWDEDGDVEEDEMRFFCTEREAYAAIDASNALRVASSSQETPNG